MTITHPYRRSEFRLPLVSLSLALAPAAFAGQHGQETA